MAIRFIAGTPEQAATRPRKFAISSHDLSKWKAGVVFDPNTPGGVALPPHIKIYNTLNQTVASYNGSASLVVDRDRVNSVRQTSSIKNGHKLSITKKFLDNNTFSWESSNPAVATINSTGLKTAELVVVSDGTTTVTATASPSGVTDSIELTCSISVGAFETLLDHFVPGSLAHHCEEAVNSRIQGATTSRLPIFSTQNHTAQTYVRNTGCWADDLSSKLTCISPWNSTGNNTRAGTLITPRHILFAAHYEISEGAAVRFVTADNQVVNRTMVKRKRHPGYNTAYHNDMTIGVLDSDVPNSITPAKTLPSDYLDYFPTTPRGVAALRLDQEEKALVGDMQAFYPILNYVALTFQEPNTAAEQDLYEPVITGDSGNPAFLIINNELVLLCVWTFGGPGEGSFVPPAISTINQMISDVDALSGNGGTGYTVQLTDLSGFTNFA